MPEMGLPLLSVRKGWGRRQITHWVLQLWVLGILPDYNRRDLQEATYVKVGNFPSCLHPSKPPQLDQCPPKSFSG